MLLKQEQISNRLLRIALQSEFDSIASQLEPVDLPRGFELAKANQEFVYCYFPESGIASVVATSPEGHRAEVGLIGRDGIVPSSAALQCGSAPHDMFMQVGGHGHRIDIRMLPDVLSTAPGLERLILRFAQVFWTQTAFTALSNATHHIDERLARWILMCHDRVDGDTIELTNEFISIMLAVRRPSVTTALHVLEGNKFIKSERGAVTLKDRPALESFARDVYGVPELEYRRLIGSIQRN